MTILQWNARGLIRKWPECKHFLPSGAPLAICIQETHFFDSDAYTFTIPGYCLYTKNVNAETRRGGVALYVLNTIPHYQIPLHTSLQAVACHVNINDHRFTICSLYLPPNMPVTETDLDQLVDQFEGEYLICADANAKHTMWGSPADDRRGRVVFEFIYNKALHTLNDGSGTRLDTFTGYLSHIDITICTLNLVGLFNWRVQADNRNSDHFPIDVMPTFCAVRQPTRNLRRTRWSLKRADWDGFSKHCNPLVTSCNEMVNPSVMCDQFSKVLIDTAQCFVPTIGIGKVKRGNLWWNDDCRKAVARRKRALMRYKRCVCQFHLT